MGLRQGRAREPKGPVCHSFQERRVAKALQSRCKAMSLVKTHFLRGHYVPDTEMGLGIPW